MLVRSATYNPVDWAIVGKWGSFIIQEFPAGGENIVSMDHNLLQVLCVRKAPPPIFKKYERIVKLQINSILKENGANVLHLLLGPDHFEGMTGSVSHVVYKEDIMEVVEFLLSMNENLIDQKNNKNETPRDVAVKLKRGDETVQFLEQKSKLTTKEIGGILILTSNVEEEKCTCVLS